MQYYYPTLAQQGFVPRGAILVDSTLYLRPYNRFFILTLLQYLWAVTGVPYICIAMGGARLDTGDYDRMLAYALKSSSAIEFLIVTWSGNDIYRLAPGPIGSVVDAATLFARRLGTYRCICILGGNAELWGYSGDPLYNERVALVATAVSPYALVCTGASDLIGIRIADAIGHIKFQSWPIIFEAYKVWRYAITRRSNLSVLGVARLILSFV